MVTWGLLDTGWARALAVMLVLGMIAALLVVAINRIGRRLDKHDEWLHRLQLQVANLHRERERERRARMQTLRPPPLSEARTVELDPDRLLTLKLEAKEKAP